MKKLFTCFLMLFTLQYVMAQPANDLCADATVLACGDALVAEDTNISTDQSADVGCGMGVGIWYTITGTGDDVTIDITNDAFDVEVAVASGACGALTNISCTDSSATSESVTFSTVAGTTYYIYVGDFLTGGVDTGTFDLAVSCETPPPVPANDMCMDAAVLACGDALVGEDTNSSTNQSTDVGCTMGAGIWYTITGTGDDVTIDVTNDAFDVEVAVASGACGALTNISCTDVGTTAESTTFSTVPGTTYYVYIGDWSSTAGDAGTFDLAVSCQAVCTSPTITATATCQPGDEGNFYVDVDVTNFGIGNTAYTVDVGGPQANITATGVTTYGPFPNGTPVDVVLTGVDDATCGATIMGLDKDCMCDPLSVEAVDDGTVCPGDPFTLNATLNDVIPGDFIDYTVTPGTAGSCTAVADNPADCVDLALGDDAGSGAILLGFNFDFFGVTYSSVCVGSNGYVTFTCVDETDFSEDPIPNATDPNAIVALFWDDLNPTDAVSGIICTYPATIGGQTCFVADYQGVAHFGGGETVTGQIIICPDNTITINCIDCQSDGGTDTAVQGIEDETGATGAFDPAFPDGVVPAAVSTSNCVTFTPNVDPDSACDFVAWVTDVNDIAGTTVSTTNPFDVNPTMTTTYFAVADCDGVPCFDDVVVTIDDPANCIVCQGIDLAAGFPVIPTTVCSGATADICLTLIDATEGLVITGTVDGAPVVLTGTAGTEANELCVTITAPVNESCAPVDVVIQIDAIQCTDGTDFPGVLGAPTLVEDLTAAGINPLNVPVYPTLTVNTSGDGMCGDLVAELVATDGTVCAAAAGSPFTCTMDGETLEFDFTADVTVFTDVPVDCPLPTLTGTLTCGGCDVTPVFTFSIDDPCNCTNGIDEDMDGINDLALETITFTPGSAPYDVTLTMPGLVDAAGTILTDTDIENLIVAADPGTGEPFDIIVYLPADGSTTYAIQVTDGNGTIVEFVKPEGCPVCPDIANIPTVGEWGLVMLCLLMSITAVVGIRQRKEEVYG